MPRKLQATSHLRKRSFSESRKGCGAAGSQREAKEADNEIVVVVS